MQLFHQSLSTYAEKPIVVGPDIVATFWKLFNHLKVLQGEIVELDDGQFGLKEGEARNRQYNEVRRLLKLHEKLRKAFSKLHGQCRRFYPANIVLS